MPTTITGTDISTKEIDVDSGTLKEIDVDSGTLFVDSSNNRVGVGTSSPSSPVTINHTGSDGDVVSFEKDGSTVGSIGVDSNDLRIEASSAVNVSGRSIFTNDIINGFRGNTSTSNNWFRIGRLSGSGARVKVEVLGQSTFSAERSFITTGVFSIGNNDEEFGAEQHSIGNQFNEARFFYERISGRTIDVWVNVGSFFRGSIRVSNLGYGFTLNPTMRSSEAEPSTKVEATSDYNLLAETIKFSDGALSENARIDSNGNLLVNTTSPNVNGRVSGTGDGKFVVDGAVGHVAVGRTGNEIIFSRPSTNYITANEPGSSFIFTADNQFTFDRVRTDDGNIIRFRTDRSTVGTITVSGSSVSYNTSSDYRLKENVKDLSDGITRLKNLPVHRFNFIGHPDKTVDGFLAHEIQPYVPEAVTGEKDAVDADGNPEYQGIDQAKLVPLLTAALQEAVAKIESLEARIETLENN